MTDYIKITKCRMSESTNLISVLSLGDQELTGVFPKSVDEKITSGPLELVWCPDSGLLQLHHSFNPSEMYGDNYGYRSGLNQSMVEHLTNKVRHLERLVPLVSQDVVIDIGSNDATLLKAYSTRNIRRIGYDPTGKKFAQYYTDDINLIPDFFSLDLYPEGEFKPKIITSIAMFYDLASPVKFAKDVESLLAPDGIWHLEQSYMPSMLRMNAYDTICHEHLEYYSFTVINNILNQAGLEVIDVTMNSINGGSFAVTAMKKREMPIIVPNNAVIDWLLEQEDRMGLSTPHPYRNFENRVFRHRQDLTVLIRSLRADGKTILGYGASTKGNVLLQFCGLTSRDITAIAEVNTEKFGCFTPGTHIPIISEQEARAMKPDYFLVLPWHFKDGILKREKEYLANGGHMIFPFPEIEIV